MHALNPLADALKDVHVSEHKPSLPSVRVTPKPERTKVVSNPVRVPVNRQAALVTAPCNSWISKPLPPEKLPTPESKEVAEIAAQLKIERNDHAVTRDALGEVRKQLRQANAHIWHLEKALGALKAQCREKEAIIAQLEDIKL